MRAFRDIRLRERPRSRALGLLALTLVLAMTTWFSAGPLWLVLAVGVVWGVAVVADSAQFSTMVTEPADQAYVGTALTVQLAVGFSLTVLTIWLVPLARDVVGWQWAFALLAPGPALGILAMLRLKSRPEASRIAHGLG